MTSQTRPGAATGAKRRLRLLRNRVRATLPGRQGDIERAVIAYRDGKLAPPPRAPGLAAAAAAERAASAASELRTHGIDRPVVLATYPGFNENPYGHLMELAYARHGLAAVHVDSVEAIDGIVAGAGDGGYRAVVHLNAADRFAPVARSEADADAAVAAAIGHLDRWRESGATIIATLHNGARLTGFRASAEQRIAQAIVDRAALIHVLTARTPEALAGWITIDPGRIHHAPHPRFDEVYVALPDRAAARARLGLDATDPPRDILVGLLGTLAARKGVTALIEAYADVPETLPDGRRVRLLLGGSITGAGGEGLIRQAMADRRTIVRFGFLPDDELLSLMAALDAAVVPYNRILNSSWLHLALTLGVPVIAPTGPTVAEVAPPEALRTFESGSRASLASALIAAGDLATPAARRAARASVAELAPDAISDGFVRAVLAATAR